MDHISFSVTEIKHELLKTLDYWSLDDLDQLYATDYKGNTRVYHIDTFRRLYNDTLETMLFYKYLCEKYYDEADHYRTRCHELENSIWQTLDPEDPE